MMGEKRNSIEDRINDLDHLLRGMEDEVKNKSRSFTDRAGPIVGLVGGIAGTIFGVIAAANTLPKLIQETRARAEIKISGGNDRLGIIWDQHRKLLNMVWTLTLENVGDAPGFVQKV